MAITTKPARKGKTKKRYVLSGWRELVHLPELGIGPIIAKLDTGAKSAALHADNIEIYQSAEGERVRFDAFVDDSADNARRCDLPLRSMRRVKNTGGQVENRAVVSTRIAVGEHNWIAEITLTDRTEMGVPMLLGRATIKKRLVVHPGKTFIVTSQERKELKSLGGDR